MENVYHGRGYIYCIEYHIVWCVKYGKLNGTLYKQAGNSIVVQVLFILISTIKK